LRGSLKDGLLFQRLGLLALRLVINITFPLFLFLFLFLLLFLRLGVLGLLDLLLFLRLRVLGLGDLILGLGVLISILILIPSFTLGLIIALLRLSLLAPLNSVLNKSNLNLLLLILSLSIILLLLLDLIWNVEES
jgi:hypothetical protein